MCGSEALHYVVTSLSVGSANIFPVTPAGKAVGAAIMMVGSALSALPAKLDEVVRELRLLKAQGAG